MCLTKLNNLHFLALIWNPFQVVWNYQSLKMDWNLCRKIWVCQRLCQFCPSCLNCHQAQKILSPKELLLDIYRLLKWSKNKSFCPGPPKEFSRQGVLHLCSNQRRRWMRIWMLKFIRANSRWCQEVTGNSLWKPIWKEYRGNRQCGDGAGDHLEIPVALHLSIFGWTRKSKAQVREAPEESILPGVK